MKFSRILEETLPILAYNPLGISDPSLAVAVSQSGGIGLIDLEGLERETGLTILEKINEMVEKWGVRISNQEHVKAVLDTQLAVPIIVIAFDIDNAALEKLNVKGGTLLAEVVSLQEAQAKEWADGYIVKGCEAGGRIGEETSFVLCQQFSQTGLKFALQGGIGLYTAASAFVGGASAIVLDGQLYLTSESPIPSSTKEFLSKIEDTDTVVLGESTSRPYRAFGRLGTPCTRELLAIEKTLLDKDVAEQEEFLEIERNKYLLGGFGSSNLANTVLPIGQDFSMGKKLIKRFRNTKGILIGLMELIQENISTTVEHFPLLEDSPFAASRGTRFPIVQGPMANVSDKADFAKAVANAGGLPFLAFASLKRDQASQVYQQFRDGLQDLPFGCGIIGLETNATPRDAHVDLMRYHNPTSVLIAAGTLSQALELKNDGIDTFLHIPSPRLLAQAIEAGLRQFVLEGMECGGHIGALSSFVLWEQALETLEDIVSSSDNQLSVEILFAGGIGTTISAAMVATMAAPHRKYLDAAVQMGSAYLLTEEALETKAITPTYQEIILRTPKTTVIGNSVNLRARAAPTPFIDKMRSRELKRVAEGVSLKERKAAFEKDNLGAGRLAAKGILRNPNFKEDGQKFSQVSEAVQIAQGNYLMGQIVSVIGKTLTIAELHEAVTYRAKAYLEERGNQLEDLFSFPKARPDDKDLIAIVGMGAIFPDAPNLEAYWSNIVNGKYSIREVPPSRWDPAFFYSSDRKAEDKTYSKIGSFLTKIPFNPLDQGWRIPPSVAKNIDPVQKLALLAAREALSDAGLLDKNLNRDRTSVIVGNSIGGELTRDYTCRVFSPVFLDALASTKEFSQLPADLRQPLLQNTNDSFKQRFHQINEDSMPGELANIIASRVASVFDLNGKSLVCDAACASSLAALDLAVKSLQDNDSDIVLWGASDTSNDPVTFVKFAKIGALSADHSAPFDASASGFVMGEGAGFCVLKRLSDARHDGDKIYAVIRGIGSSSDGKGKGITAPNPKGQTLAINRAFASAAVDPADIGLIEAHGTSTPIGDGVELKVLDSIFKDGKASLKSVAVGSVKSQIGHTKSAAGIAAVIKVALALHHRVKPGSINCRDPNPKVNWAESPIYVNTKTVPWESMNGGKRRAGVSCFGFGGINYHTILEEYDENGNVASGPLSDEKIGAISPVQPDLAIQAKLEGIAKPILLGDQTSEGINTKLQEFKSKPESFSCDISSPESAPFRLGLVWNSNMRAIERITLQSLQDPKFRLLAENQGVFFGENSFKGKICFLFPGQGSQYVGMLKELYDVSPTIRETLKEADDTLEPVIGRKISKIIFDEVDPSENASELLKKTQYTQPAVITVDIALYRFLAQMGLKPDMVAGHSLGEYGALVAAGVLSFRDALVIVSARGKGMANIQLDDQGIMASVGTDYETVEAILNKVSGYVIAANKNSPQQTVIAGTTKAVFEAIAKFEEEGISAIVLPVSSAFHSEIVKSACEPLQRVLAKTKINSPIIPVLSNVTGDFYPDESENICELLTKQVASPVEWIKQIKRMRQEGGTFFVEVGPKRVLSQLAKANLEEDVRNGTILSVASNHPKKGAFWHISEVIAAAFAKGIPVTLPDFYDRTTQGLPQLAAEKVDSQIASPAVIVSNIEHESYEDSKLPRLPMTSTINDLESRLQPYLRAMIEEVHNACATSQQKKQVPQNMGNSETPVVIVGAALGLPGQSKQVFDDSNIDMILHGQNFIDSISQQAIGKIVEKNIVRVVKQNDEDPHFQPVADESDSIKLAGQKGSFNLHEEFGVPEALSETLDVTSQLALAAGIDALRNAGIPLIKQSLLPSNMGHMGERWALPEELRDETGVIFASLFPGFDSLLEGVHRAKQSSEFNRKILLAIMGSLGASQFAQYIGARGPNTLVNAACSSTSHAIAVGEDWIRLGRCKRVIVIAADDVTNSNLFEWVGSGFLAAGAATTIGKVEEAALPFDKRRNGLILGMGAVGIVLESQETAEDRGVIPIAELLGTRISNSAFHGTRLNPDHIILEMERFIKQMEERWDIKRTEIAKELVFVSHETYTPARGGSASAEVAMLRKTFGDELSQVLIANTKGFTGHSMGAGIEDSVALGILEKMIVPPIANLKEIDPSLGNLRYSKGGTYNDIRYVLRFAAGFGSQVALTLFRKPESDQSDRFASTGYEAWLNSMGGTRDQLEVVKRTLRLRIPQVSSERVTQSVSPILGSISSGHESISNEIISIVAEKTGYPASVLELDMDLEADLGIDTVKQAELFGLIRERWKLAREKGVKLSEFPTLNHIIKYISQRLEPLKSQSKGPSREEILREIVEIVAEKTGYPADVLTPDLDLEADLGIDTVKQAELFGLIRKQYDIPRIKGTKIADYPNLDLIADFVVNYEGENLPEEDNKPIEELPTPLTANEDASEEPVKRYTIELVERQLGLPSFDLKGKSFLVLSQKNDFSETIIRDLQDKEVKILSYDLTQYGTPQRLREELRSSVPVDGVIYVAPSDNSESIWTQERLDGKNLFAISQALKFKDHPRMFVATQSPFFGWTKKDSPWVGSVTGFMKALAREKEGIYRVIACHDSEQVMQELEITDEVVEIGYWENKRYCFQVRQDQLKTDQVNSVIDSTDLLVVTGGAQGITYECLRKIAKLWKPKIAIMGRTKKSNDPETLMKDFQTKSHDSIRLQIIDELKANHDRVTPVMIESAWNNHQKMAQIERSLEELRELDSEVRYYSVDVTDPLAMRSIMEQIHRDFDSEITGILHGAGIEKSKAVDRKTDSEFNLIHDTKVLGFCNLMQNVNLDHLKACILFSSIAGRFGNVGQVDYSAANDFLAKAAWFLRKQDVPAVAIDWSAWKEIGMATKGSTLQVMSERGITAIPTNQAVSNLIKEIKHGNTPEVVIAGSLGVFSDQSNVGEMPSLETFPMIDSFAESEKGNEVVTEHNLTLESDPFLKDHQINGIPVLPGVFGLEMFQETYECINSSKKVVGFENVKFKSAIKLLSGEGKKILCRMSQERQVLESARPPIQGVKSTLPIVHFEAQLKTSQDLSKGKLLPISFTDLPVLLEKEQIYSVLFHGPRFRLLKTARALIPEVIAEVELPSESLIPGFANERFRAPLTIESGFQTAGLYCMVHHLSEVIPVAVDQILLYQQASSPRCVRATPTGKEGDVFRFDIVIIGDNNELLCELKGCHFAEISKIQESSLPRILRPRESNVTKVQQLFQRMETPITAVSINSLEAIVKTIPTFLEAWLRPQELEHCYNFKNGKRQNEWLAGVIAAKTNFLNHIGSFCTPLEIEVMKKPSGAPIVSYFPTSTNAKDFPVTISHRMGIAVAYVSFNGGRPGIDLEWLENKPQAFLEEAFTPQEQVLLVNHDSPQLASVSLWAAKEAVLKSVGLGLDCDLHELQTDAVPMDGSIHLAMAGDLHRKAMEKDWPTSYEVMLEHEKKFVGALCKSTSSA
ncbi:MAG: SDR family NAD(P)-dependent oxidoreductase [Candidatus Heimdallarchaeota archaeon]